MKRWFLGMMCGAVAGVILLLSPGLGLAQQMTMEEYEAELASWRERQRQAIETVRAEEEAIEACRAEIQQLDSEIAGLENQILAALGIADQDVERFRTDQADLEAQVNRLRNMSEADLAKDLTQIEALQKRLAELKQQPASLRWEFNEPLQALDQTLTDLHNRGKAYKPPVPTPDTHVVVKGESLWKISGYERIYNDPVKWPRLYRANRDKIKDPNLIYPGQALTVPRGFPNRHLVVRGEWLSKIAGYWEIYDNWREWPRIYEANKHQIKDPNLIYPNQELVIPR